MLVNGLHLARHLTFESSALRCQLAFIALLKEDHTLVQVELEHEHTWVLVADLRQDNRPKLSELGQESGQFMCEYPEKIRVKLGNLAQ
jgi:hypothetical protein